MSSSCWFRSHCCATWREVCCVTVSHVCMCDRPLSPFTGITKQSRPSNPDGPPKTWTYYREVRLAEQLSTVPNKVYLFAFLKNLAFLSPRTWRFILASPPYEWSVLRFSLLSLAPSLSQTSCAAPRRPEAARLTSQRNASQANVLSAVCEQSKGQGRLLEMCSQDAFPELTLSTAATHHLWFPFIERVANLGTHLLTDF